MPDEFAAAGGVDAVARTYDIVVPTVGRTSLSTLLRSLADSAADPRRLIIVDDRPAAEVDAPLDVPAGLDGLASRTRVLRSGGRGPAAARNLGWRAGDAPWVAFVDDDVVVPPSWGRDLAADIRRAGPAIGGVQGNIVVPLRSGRRPTDRERNVCGLERARWATADMAYRRHVLEAVGGFDERFRRAYREDADLGLRVVGAGWSLARGERSIAHPVLPADAWISVRQQAGNADDALMGRVHGRGWRVRANAPRGRFRWHVATVGAGAAAIAAAAGGRRRWAALAGAVWALLTAVFAWRRIAPGPRTREEVRAMTATSIAIPWAAVWHRARGHIVTRSATAWTGRPAATRPAVLLDRDGTVVEDVPYNADPGRVSPMPGAGEAIDRLRRAGVPTAMITNQSGVARGRLSSADVARVNRRIEELVGPIGPWLVCQHGPEDGCGCRKPQPGLVLRAAELLGVDPRDCVVIGDTAADLEAAAAVGARAILVPNDVTLRVEIESARETATSLDEAVGLVLGDRR
jgi:histidinol-phosphate phosphatase family protein